MALQAMLTAAKAAATQAQGGGLVYQKWANPPIDTLCDTPELQVPGILSCPRHAGG